MRNPAYQGPFKRTYRATSVLSDNWNILQDLRERELCNGKLPDRGLSYLRKQTVPNSVLWALCSVHDVYCGTFNKSGDQFFSASVDGRVSVFDYTGRYLRLKRTFQCEDAFEGFNSMAQSPDQRYLVLASGSRGVYLVDIGSSSEFVIGKAVSGSHRRVIYSLAFCGTSNSEILYCASKSRIAIFDIVTETCKDTFTTPGSVTDVKAIAWLQDGASTFLAGSEDTCIRVYDTRVACSGPRAVYPGHFDGITYIDSRNDGRYFLSNSKDQTVRLWDVRLCSPINEEKRVRPLAKWNYKTQHVPRIYLNSLSEEVGFKSLLTLRGHSVRYSEIRAKFSPLHSTGQQFAYSGSANGGWVVWDLTTGEKVAHNRIETAVVRDVAWHPWQSVLISSGMNGLLTCWNFRRLEKPPSTPLILENPEIDMEEMGEEALRFYKSEAGEQRSVDKLRTAGFQYKFPAKSPNEHSPYGETVFHDEASDDNGESDSHSEEDGNVDTSLMTEMTRNTLEEYTFKGISLRSRPSDPNCLRAVSLRRASATRRRRLCSRLTALSRPTVRRQLANIPQQCQRNHERDMLGDADEVGKNK